MRIPSPLEELRDDRLAKAGVRVLLKRDDLINPDVPGNKWRKLKYNLAEAERSGHRTLLTFGGAYSKLYSRLINGDRGGYLGYATWRKYLKLAQGYTAAHPDGIVSYTAHELRHVCASLLIASGASDMQVAHQMGHSRIETTKNIYGHLFAQDRASILEALNQAVSRLYAYENPENGSAGTAA